MGMSEPEFQEVAREIHSAWDKAQTRDQAFLVIVQYGQKLGYKNVIAAIQNRVPKRYTREKSVSEWVADRRAEEAVD